MAMRTEAGGIFRRQRFIRAIGSDMTFSSRKEREVGGCVGQCDAERLSRRRRAPSIEGSDDVPFRVSVDLGRVSTVEPRCRRYPTRNSCCHRPKSGKIHSTSNALNDVAVLESERLLLFRAVVIAAGSIRGRTLANSKIDSEAIASSA